MSLVLEPFQKVQYFSFQPSHDALIGAYKEPSHRSSYKVVICIFAIELIYIYWKMKKNIKEFIQSAINARLWKADSYATTNEVWLLQ